MEDIDFENNVVDVCKSLQYQDLKVDDFFYDSTKNEGSMRKVLLPDVAMEAIKRTIERGNKFDEQAKKKPFKSYRSSQSLFRTEYGAPITPHSFREMLHRVEQDLIHHSEERYGFKWVKHITPHGFRHMHITYLQAGEVNLQEVMSRVGHSNAETTMIYSHRTIASQLQAVKALEDFVHNNEFTFGQN